MQKWEYLTIRVAMWETLFANYKDIRFRDAEGKIIGGIFLADYLNGIGEKGWEVVGTSYPIQTTTGELWTIIAKRPKE